MSDEHRSIFQGISDAMDRGVADVAAAERAEEERRVHSPWYLLGTHRPGSVTT